MKISNALGIHMKLISMSLYGDKVSYLKGAIINARLREEIYPDWKLRIYICSQGFPAPEITELRNSGCELIEMPPSKEHSGMFWRFFAAWDIGIERVIFRDTDSRLNKREAMAVKEWEESGLDAHCMKDHPHHARMPMLGGMWGIKNYILPRALFNQVKVISNNSVKRVGDMHFLANKVHPLIEGSILRHSSVETKWPHVPFPEGSEIDGFVGQQYNENGGINPTP